MEPHAVGNGQEVCGALPSPPPSLQTVVTSAAFTDSCGESQTQRSTPNHTPTNFEEDGRRKGEALDFTNGASKQDRRWITRKRPSPSPHPKRNKTTSSFPFRHQGRSTTGSVLTVQSRRSRGKAPHSPPRASASPRGSEQLAMTMPAQGTTLSDLRACVSYCSVQNLLNNPVIEIRDNGQTWCSRGS